jgi:hypothetical protein
MHHALCSMSGADDTVYLEKRGSQTHALFKRFRLAK